MDPRIKARLAAAGLSGALLMFVTQQVFNLAQRVAALEARVEYRFGAPTTAEAEAIKEEVK